MINLDDIRFNVDILYPLNMESFVKEHAGFAGWHQYLADIDTLQSLSLASNFSLENENGLVAAYLHTLFTISDISEVRKKGFMSLVERQN